MLPHHWPKKFKEKSLKLFKNTSPAEKQSNSTLEKEFLWLCWKYLNIPKYRALGFNEMYLWIVWCANMTIKKIKAKKNLSRGSGQFCFWLCRQKDGSSELFREPSNQDYRGPCQWDMISNLPNMWSYCTISHIMWALKYLQAPLRAPLPTVWSSQSFPTLEVPRVNNVTLCTNGWKTTLDRYSHCMGSWKPLISLGPLVHDIMTT